MSINAIRGLVLLANVILLGLIGWAGYTTFFFVDEPRWEVEIPKYEKFQPPQIAQDERQQQQALYKVISKAFDPPPPPPVQVETTKPEAPLTADVSKITVLWIQYNPREPDRSSALLTGPMAADDPSSRPEKRKTFFMPGQDLGATNLGFEAYKGAKVKSISENEVILTDQKGNEVRLPGPRQAVKKESG